MSERIPKSKSFSSRPVGDGLHNTNLRKVTDQSRNSVNKQPFNDNRNAKRNACVQRELLERRTVQQGDQLTKRSYNKSSKLTDPSRTATKTFNLGKIPQKSEINDMSGRKSTFKNVNTKLDTKPQHGTSKNCASRPSPPEVKGVKALTSQFEKLSGSSEHLNVRYNKHGQADKGPVSKMSQKVKPERVEPKKNVNRVLPPSKTKSETAASNMAKKSVKGNFSETAVNAKKQRHDAKAASIVEKVKPVSVQPRNDKNPEKQNIVEPKNENIERKPSEIKTKTKVLMKESISKKTPIQKSYAKPSPKTDNILKIPSIEKDSGFSKLSNLKFSKQAENVKSIKSNKSMCRNVALPKSQDPLPSLPKGPLRLKILENYLKTLSPQLINNEISSAVLLDSPAIEEPRNLTPEKHVSTCTSMVPYVSPETGRKCFLNPAIVSLLEKNLFQNDAKFCLVPITQEKINQVKALLKKKKANHNKLVLFPMSPDSYINKTILLLLHESKDHNEPEPHDGSGDHQQDTFNDQFYWEKCSDFEESENGIELRLIHTDTRESATEHVVLGLYVFKENNDGKSLPKYKETHGKYKTGGKIRGDPLYFLNTERLASLKEEDVSMEKDENSLRQFTAAVQRYQDYSKKVKSKSKKALYDMDTLDYRSHLFQYDYSFKEELTLDVEFSDDEDDLGNARRKEGDLTNLDVNATYKASTTMNRERYWRPDNKECKPPAPYTAQRQNGLDYADQLGVYHDYVPRTKITYNRTHHVLLFQKMRKVLTGHPKSPYVLTKTGKLIRREHIINCLKVEAASDDRSNKICA